MAHLWIEQSTTDEGGEPARCWCALPLDGDAFALCDGRPVASSKSSAGSSPLLWRDTRDGVEAWSLLADSRLRVNGVPVSAGLRALRHRDELRLPLRDRGAAFAFFSTEHLIRVLPFPGMDRLLRCPRCTLVIEADSPAVRCECGLWYHEAADLACWSYAEFCSRCPCATAPSSTFRWSPEAL